MKVENGEIKYGKAIITAILVVFGVVMIVFMIVAIVRAIFYIIYQNPIKYTSPHLHIVNLTHFLFHCSTKRKRLTLSLYIINIRVSIIFWERRIFINLGSQNLPY